MAFTTWNTLLMGKLRTDAEEEEREKSGEKGRAGFTPTWKRNETEKKMCATLARIGKEVGTDNIRAGTFINTGGRSRNMLLTSAHAVVAIAYHLQKQPHVLPCIGGRKVEHLLSNLEALKIVLTKEHI